jgi:hypothetical protein
MARKPTTSRTGALLSRRGHRLLRIGVTPTGIIAVALMLRRLDGAPGRR